MRGCRTDAARRYVGEYYMADDNAVYDIGLMTTHIDLGESNRPRVPPYDDVRPVGAARAS